MTIIMYLRYLTVLLSCRTISSQSPDCGGTFTSDSGEITSPGYPNDYTHFLSCTYNIKPSVGYPIQLLFEDFDTEPDHDFVEVYDSNGDMISKLSGSKTGTAVTPSTEYRVVLTTDNSVTKRGFKATWEYGGTFTADSGEMTSPNFPDDPNPYADTPLCSYTIAPSSGSPVQLLFQVFKTEPGQSVVEVYSSGVLLDSLSGTKDDTVFAPSTAGYLLVFNVVQVCTLRRFKAIWDTWGGNYTGNTGAIQSPFYPNNYPDHAACTYTIASPDGQLLRLTFDDFETEDTFDYVRVYNSAGNMVANLTGVQHDTVVTSSTYYRVVMTSGSWTTKRGFSAFWAVAPTASVNLNIGLHVMTCPVSLAMSLVSPVGAKVKVMEQITLDTDSDCKTTCLLLPACTHCNYETLNLLCTLYEYDASSSKSLTDVYVKM